MKCQKIPFTEFSGLLIEIKNQIARNPAGSTAGYGANNEI